MVASKPFLFIVRSAEVETFRETQTPCDSKKNLFVFKFGKNLRLVLLLACDTLLPTCVLLPVIWQTFAIVLLNIIYEKND